MINHDTQVFGVLPQLLQHTEFATCVAVDKTLDGFDCPRNQFIFDPEIEQGVSRFVLGRGLGFQTRLEYRHVQIAQLLHFGYG